QALAAVVPATLAAASLFPVDAARILAKLSEALQWPLPPTIDAGDNLPSRQHICRKLAGFGPLELLLETASTSATGFAELAQTLFPDCDAALAEAATDGLLALGTFARRTEPGREDQPLLPTRVHLLFRGLPPLYVCISHECSARREGSSNALAGKMYT